MAEENQENTSVDPASLSVKRKRGRPRKDDDPGSEPGRRRQRRKADQSAYSGDVFVGQAVSGVLDGKFDAGYMLTVRVGSSETFLKGIVFEPGLSVPISATIDIAPNVTMLRRADVPIPHIEPRQLTKKDTDAIPLKGTVKPVPEDSIPKLPTGSLVETTKVENDHNSVPKDTIEVRESDINLKSPLTASLQEAVGEANLSTTAAPQSVASEPMEVRAIDTLDKQLMQSEGTIESSSTVSVPEVSAQSSISEPKNMEIDETSKGQLANPAITPQTVVQASEDKIDGIPNLEENVASLQPAAPAVDVPSSECSDKILTGNAAAEETTDTTDQKAEDTVQSSESEIKPKDSCSNAETQPTKTKPPSPSPSPSQQIPQQVESGEPSPTDSNNQVSNVTEASKDGDSQTVADTGSNMS